MSESPLDPEFLARLERADAGEGPSDDPIARIVTALRTDLADRPDDALLRRLRAIGAPRPATSVGGSWWQTLEAAVAELVGRSMPGLAGVRSAAAATHLAFETGDLAVDLSVQSISPDRWRIEGVAEPIDPAGPTPRRLAALRPATETEPDLVAEHEIDLDGRFAFTVPTGLHAILLEHGGRAIRLDLPDLTDDSGAA